MIQLNERPKFATKVVNSIACISHSKSTIIFYYQCTYKEPRWTKKQQNCARLSQRLKEEFFLIISTSRRVPSIPDGLCSVQKNKSKSIDAFANFSFLFFLPSVPFKENMLFIKYVISIDLRRNNTVHALLYYSGHVSGENRVTSRHIVVCVTACRALQLFCTLLPIISAL